MANTSPKEQELSADLQALVTAGDLTREQARAMMPAPAIPERELHAYTHADLQALVTAGDLTREQARAMMPAPAIPESASDPPAPTTTPRSSENTASYAATSSRHIEPLFNPHDRTNWGKMVGRRVCVRWGFNKASDTKWYRGKCTNYTKYNRKHTVLYDDGDTSTYNLLKKSFRIEGEGLLYDGEDKNWPDPQSWTEEKTYSWMLWKAAETGDADTIRLMKPELLETPLDEQGCWTPMILACEYGHLNVVQTLISLGASVNKTSNFGTAPTYAASRRGHFHIVEHLLDHGADVNSTHDDGTPMLTEAAIAGYVDIVKILIESDADVNIARKQDGATTLIMAASRARTECVRLLLQAGADTTCRMTNTSNIQTALEIAKTGVIKKLIANAGPAAERRANFLRPKQCRREWARLLAASAGVTVPFFYFPNLPQKISTATQRETELRCGAVPLLRFMEERPGLVRYVGSPILRYYRCSPKLTVSQK